MPFPTTIEELKAAGYVFENHANCRGCGETIEWWKTPRGKKMPMDVDQDGNCESHFSTCPNAKNFRKD
jgi:hypothetical protein